MVLLLRITKVTGKIS